MRDLKSGNPVRIHFKVHVNCFIWDPVVGVVKSRKASTFFRTDLQPSALMSLPYYGSAVV